MRKLTALLLALTLMFSLVIAVSADETTDTTVTLKKLYTVTGATGTGIFPNETLEFISTPADSNPTEANLTIANLVVDGTDGELTITLPEYDTIGQYVYTISEKEGNTQGVTYTDATIDVTVLVSYDDNHELKAELFLTQKVSEGSAAKVDTFNNEYELGKLNVTKVVEGNLGSQDAEFDMTVTFTSDKPVLSDITYVDGNTTGTIAYENGWTEANGQYTATASIKVKHGETVSFTNIPAGVTYLVEEDEKHTLGQSDTMDPNSPADEDYKVEYTNNSGTITVAGADPQLVTVTNTKQTAVETGVVLDSMPYVLILTATLVGMAALLGKKRYEV